MADSYSFLGHPFDIILRNAHSFFPGIDKTIAVYFDPELNNLQAKCVSRDFLPGQIETLELGDLKVILQKNRLDKTHYSWCNKDNVPFVVRPPVSKQVQILDEYSNIILQLRFPNEYDNCQDMLFLYFRENTGNFGVSTNNRLLSTENKAIISFVLYNFLKTLFDIIHSDNTLHKSISESTVSFMSRYAILTDDLKKTRKNYGEGLVNFCQYHLNEFSSQYNRNYCFSDAAKEKIKTYSGDIRNLLKIVNNAVLFINNMDSVSNSADSITVQEWYLNFAQFAEQENSAVKADILVGEKYEKTWMLLDKLENAAREVKANNKKLISENVGMHCPTPITAPAITDAVKKHYSKIIFLMKKYPDRWTIIRNEFRPVKKLISGGI